MKNLELLATNDSLIFKDEGDTPYWSDGFHLYVGDKGNKNMPAKGRFLLHTGEFVWNGMKNQKIKIIQ